MSDWTDVLETLTMGNSSVTLFCTATTGLKSSDKVLAVSYVQYEGDTRSKEETFFQEASDEELAPSLQYHQISSEVMKANGLKKEAFQERLQQILTNRIAFTYNVSFQLKALMIMNGGLMESKLCPVCELPLWVKVAESKLHFVVDIPLERAESQMANRVPIPTWKRMLDFRGISPVAPPGMLPVAYNAQCLAQLYEGLFKQSPDIELALR